MLADWSCRGVREFDEEVFRACIPQDHFLRRALALIPWESFFELLAPFYCRDHGRPAELPVLMLKLEFLRFLFVLSDAQVVARAQTDMAFRYFLQIGVRERLPDSSSLCRFRGRLGVVGFQQVFNQVLSAAREAGLVKDRLRIKDATHVIADVAIPTTLGLLAQIRDKLLAAAEPFDPERTAGEQAGILLLRQAYADRGPEERLVARVTHLREMLAWMDELPAPPDPQDRQWVKFEQVRKLAHKILADRENPQAGDRTISVVDPDARRGRHGEFFDGYLVDVLVDADSELITSVNVLPANGDEAADAAELLRQEEAAHGNDVEQLSIDGIGYQGPMLRELEDAEGLAVDVIVPPKQDKPAENFRPAEFIQNEDGSLTCPAGETTTNRSRNSRNTATVYRFPKGACAGCPLRTACLENPQAKGGRGVHINDYQAEYDRARAKVGTAAYEAVRREHPKVERKLSDIVRRHGGRRARVRGRPKVLCQQLMACAAANIKRMIRLGCAPTPAPAH